MFRKKWEKITQDQWVLSVLREGLKLDFLSKPPFTGVRQTNVSAQHVYILLQEVDKLFKKKDAIEPVPPDKIQTGFFFHYFSLFQRKRGI